MFEERQRSCACVGDRVKHCQYCGNTGEEYLRHARGDSHPWHGGRLAAAFMSAGGCWDPRRLARVAGLRLRLACRCPLFVAVPLGSALQPASVSLGYEYDCGRRTDRGGSGSAADTAGWAVVVGRVDPQGGLGPVVAVELLFRCGPPPPTPLCPAAPLSTPVPPPPFERPDSGPAPFPVGRRRARAGTESAQGLGLVPSAWPRVPEVAARRRGRWGRRLRVVICLGRCWPGWSCGAKPRWGVTGGLSLPVAAAGSPRADYGCSGAS